MHVREHERGGGQRGGLPPRHPLFPLYLVTYHRSGPALSALYINSFYPVNILVASSISLTMKLSHREVKQLALDHTAGGHRAQSRVSNPGSLAPESLLLLTILAKEYI